MDTTEIEKNDQWSTRELNKIDSQKIKRFIKDCHQCKITNQYDNKKYCPTGNYIIYVINPNGWFSFYSIISKEEVAEFLNEFSNIIKC